MTWCVLLPQRHQTTGCIHHCSGSRCRYESVLHYQTGRLLIPESIHAADAHRYACGDTKQDPEATAHLAGFGIHLRSLKIYDGTGVFLSVPYRMLSLIIP